jgi:hypothetical protein
MTTPAISRRATWSIRGFLLTKVLKTPHRLRFTGLSLTNPISLRFRSGALYVLRRCRQPNFRQGHYLPSTAATLYKRKRAGWQPKKKPTCSSRHVLVVNHFHFLELLRAHGKCESRKEPLPLNYTDRALRLIIDIVPPFAGFLVWMGASLRIGLFVVAFIACISAFTDF